MKKYGMFLLGAIILTFGVAMVIQANLGSGAWDAVNVGVNLKIGVSIGTSAILLSIVFIILAGLLRDRVFHPYTFFAAIILGSCTDFWLAILKSLSLPTDTFSSYLQMGLGILLTALGLGMYLYANVILNPLDDFMMAFQKKLPISVGSAKLIIDGCGVFLAFLLGAPLGIGTILATCFVGPLANPIYRFLLKRETAAALKNSVD